jgi:hypothetical protein
MPQALGQVRYVISRTCESTMPATASTTRYPRTRALPQSAEHDAVALGTALQAEQRLVREVAPDVSCEALSMPGCSSKQSWMRYDRQAVRQAQSRRSRAEAPRRCGRGEPEAAVDVGIHD